MQWWWGRHSLSSAILLFWRRVSICYLLVPMCLFTVVWASYVSLIRVYIGGSLFILQLTFSVMFSSVLTVIAHTLSCSSDCKEPLSWGLHSLWGHTALCKQSPVGESPALSTTNHKVFKMFIHLEVQDIAHNLLASLSLLSGVTLQGYFRR